MSRGTRVRLTLFLSVMAWLVVVPVAQAYIDPGSTSLIFSALIAGLAAAGTAVAMFWHRITSVFRRKDPTAQVPEPEADSANSSERV